MKCVENVQGESESRSGPPVDFRYSPSRDDTYPHFFTLVQKYPSPTLSSSTLGHRIIRFSSKISIAFEIWAPCYYELPIPDRMFREQ